MTCSRDVGDDAPIVGAEHALTKLIQSGEASLRLASLLFSLAFCRNAQERDYFVALGRRDVLLKYASARDRRAPRIHSLLCASRRNLGEKSRFKSLVCGSGTLSHTTLRSSAAARQAHTTIEAIRVLAAHAKAVAARKSRPYHFGFLVNVKSHGGIEASRRIERRFGRKTGHVHWFTSWF